MVRNWVIVNVLVECCPGDCSLCGHGVYWEVEFWVDSAAGMIYVNKNADVIVP